MKQIKSAFNKLTEKDRLASVNFRTDVVVSIVTIILMTLTLAGADVSSISVDEIVQVILEGSVLVVKIGNIIYHTFFKPEEEIIPETL